MEGMGHCAGCGMATPHENLVTCMTSPFEGDELGVPDLEHCSDQYFYCEACRNKFDFCLRCASKIPVDRQIEMCGR
jgi:ribosomal protein S26